MKLSILFLPAVVLVCACCGSVTPAPNPGPAPPASGAASTGGAAPAPAPADVCDEACAELAALGCPEALPAGGQSCSRVCVHTLGGVFDLKPACIAAAHSRAEVRACGTVKCDVP